MENKGGENEISVGSEEREEKVIFAAVSSYEISRTPECKMGTAVKIWTEA